MTENIYNPEFIKEHFDRMSSSYERMNYVTSFGFSIRWRNQFVGRFSTTNEPVEVIDLLTGMGETWATTKHHFPNCRLTALDFSEGMLKHAMKRNKDNFNNQVTVLQQDILKNQLPSNHFDYVTCAFGLKTFNAEQLQILATETKRILKPNGQFSFIEVSTPQSKFLQLFYGFYLGKIIPILGKILRGNPSEYKMLWKYTSEFGNARHAAEIFKNEGLMVQYNSYFYGCATGFSGQKDC